MQVARAQGAQLFELWERPTGGAKRKVVGLEADGTDEGAEFFERIEARRKLQDEAMSFVVRACDAGGATVAQVLIASAAAPEVMLAVAHGHGGNGASNGTGAAAQAFGSMLLTMPQMMQSAFSSLQRENEQQRKTVESLVRTSTSGFDAYVRSYERTFADMQSRIEKLTLDNGELRARFAASEAELKVAREEHAELSRMKLLELAEIERSSKRDDFLKSQLGLLLPVIAAKAAPALGLPSAPIGAALAKRFADSLSSEQRDAIFRMLQPAQQTAMVHLLAGRGEGEVDAVAEPANARAGEGSKNGSEAHAEDARPIATTLNDTFARMLAAPAAEREALFRTLELDSTFGFFQLFCDWVDAHPQDAAPAIVAAALSGGKHKP